VEDRKEQFFEPLAAVDAFEKAFGTVQAFLAANAVEIADCLDSFAYLSVGERRRYKLAMDLIDDPEKRRKFRDDHEDRARSSLNQICRRAWQLAESIRQASGKVDV
jgi:hypothetical protein